VAVNGPVLSIRRFASSARALPEFTNDSGVDLCTDIVRSGANVVVSGATSSGKTSLLAALLGVAGPDERIVVLEDTAELPCDAPHLVRLEARPASVEGLAPIPLDDLVRTALRLRPDRLIVGEVRGPEALDMIQAMSTGHDGSMSAMHANGPEEALWRLETLALSGAVRVAEATVRRQIRSAVDLVVEVRRRSGRRVVSSIVAVADDRIEAVWRC
jgi:pilus assembly protein CpaF